MAAVAILALAVLLYTYVGYPVLIWWLARRCGVPVRGSASFRPMVSVLLPVYNGEDHLREKLSSLVGQEYAPGKLEILVYLDGCTDRSARIARDLAERHPHMISVIEGRERRGKPTALNVMVARAQGDVFLMTDTRQPIVPHALADLVNALADPTVGCASGNLVLHGQTGAGLYWRYENWIRHSEANYRSMIGATGPLYAIRRALFTALPEDLILDDVWLPMHARMNGFRTVFVSSAVALDTAFGDSREFGRKARTLAGNYQLLARMPEILLPWRNPSWMETVSHKLLRLLGPWFLVVLMVASLSGVSEPTSLALVALAGAQVLFYVAAIFGERLGRAGAAAKSFVVMNVAAVVGLIRFVTDRQKVTW